MARRETYDAAGVLLERWDTTTGYTRYDGTIVVEQRALNTAEAAALAADQAAADRATVGATLRADARTQIAVLMASIDTLKTVTDKTNATIGPADTKTVARETRRVARQLVRITRLMLDALETADVGTDA